MVNSLDGINHQHTLPHGSHSLVLSFLMRFWLLARGFQFYPCGIRMKRQHDQPVGGAAAANPLNLPDFPAEGLDPLHEVVLDVAFPHACHTPKTMKQSRTSTPRAAKKSSSMSSAAQ